MNNINNPTPKNNIIKSENSLNSPKNTDTDEFPNLSKIKETNNNGIKIKDHHISAAKNIMKDVRAFNELLTERGFPGVLRNILCILALTNRINNCPDLAELNHGDNSLSNRILIELNGQHTYLEDHKTLGGEMIRELKIDQGNISMSEFSAWNQASHTYATEYYDMYPGIPTLFAILVIYEKDNKNKINISPYLNDPDIKNAIKQAILSDGQNTLNKQLMILL